MKMHLCGCGQEDYVDVAIIECQDKAAARPAAAHWFFLEIFVRKFKRGNQRVLVQNWVKNVGINKCSLSKNLKNGPKLQL